METISAEILEAIIRDLLDAEGLPDIKIRLRRISDPMATYNWDVSRTTRTEDNAAIQEALGRLVPELRKRYRLSGE